MADKFDGRFAAAQLARENSIPKEAAQAADPFWHTADIDELRWDKNYPFQILMVKHEGGGRYSPIPLGRFTLPIGPSAISKTMPFAITGHVTQGGYIEDHNGTPIRTITLQGTTGVLPLKGTGKVLASPNLASSIFAGTIVVAQNTNNTIASLRPDNGFVSNQVTDDEIIGDLKGTTGYYQFLLFQYFLEAYSNMKKFSQHANLRLAFAQWKTQEVYLIRPEVFTVTQQPGTTRYNYTFSFTAWRRIDLKKSEPPASVVKPVSRSPGKLQTVLNAIDDSRRVLAQLKDVISAAGQDVETVLFEPLRSTSLFLKDAIGVPATAADLPVSIVRSMKGAILEAAGIPAAVNDTASSFANLGNNLGVELADMDKKLTALSVSSGKAETRAGQPDLGKKRQAAGADPAEKILENPQDNFELFQKIKPGNLNLPPATTRKIIEERERVRKLNRLDFEKMRDGMVALMTEFEDRVGAGGATYNRIYNRTGSGVVRTPTQDEFDAIYALNASIMEMNKLAASGDVGDRTKVDAIEYVAGLAGRSGINFQIPRSKLQIPFPYNSTLERIAAQYLGDPDRWHEIAALNGLRAPYVDEVGFSLPLLVNGTENTIWVSDASNLFVGQPVWIASSTTSREKRRIQSIDKVSETSFRLTLDGDPDLDRFTTQGDAFIHAFLPDTVNSQMMIFIPSDQDPATEDFDGKSIPGIDQFDLLLHAGGVDLALTANGDAAITKDGDWRLAVGMANLVQYVRTFFGTPRGSLLHHPTWGIGLRPGVSTADIDAKDVLSSIKDLMSFNPVFTGVRAASVLKKSGSMQIAASLEVSGSSFLLPITLELKL